MLLFPNAKINVGLDIIAKRPDGYHDISTAMLPVGWNDILEIVPARGERTTLTITGLKVDCPDEKNLIMKAYRALGSEITLPPVDIYLHKIIPHGAGLGGGSSDAAFTIRGLNEMFSLGLTDSQLAEIAVEIGADCPFFIYNRPMLAEGIGEILTPLTISSANPVYIAIAKPDISISTARAYSGTRPAAPLKSLKKTIEADPSLWRDNAVNAFESSLAHDFPFIEQMKSEFYKAGAFYASLSGSGSAVFGLFNNDKMAEDALKAFPQCRTYSGKMNF